MDETIRFEKVISIEMDFKTFKENYHLQADEVYEDVWKELVKNANDTKYGYFQEKTYLTQKDVNDDLEPMNEFIERKIRNAYEECKSAYYDKLNAELTRIRDECRAERKAELEKQDTTPKKKRKLRIKKE